MLILPFKSENELINLKIKDYESLIEEFISPLVFNPNSFNEPRLVSSLVDMTNTIKVETLKYILEKADSLFRYSKDRVNRYYVKNTRNRTIITMLGEVTYLRSEYISRDDNSSFIYVDELLGLERKERYTNSIKSMIYASYADNLSMRKTGIEVANTINGYSINPNRIYRYIPRQQIKNILKNFGVIKAHYKRRDYTPNTIYIMFDEKYIHSQFNNHKDIMVKHAVIFESREVLSKDKAKNRRYKYINKVTVSSIDEDLHLKVLDILNELYDYDKIKHIHVMGDGASWIKDHIDVFKSPNNNVDFALDKFHLGKAINNITGNDSSLNKVILSYILNNDKSSLNETAKELINTDYKLKQHSYILNNWKYIDNMYHKVKIGCAMEQAIEHDLACVYASIPKAYYKDNLKIYLSGRDLFRNNIDLINVSLEALNNKGISDGCDIKENLDLSYFDKQDYIDRYHLTFSDKLRLDSTL